MKITFRNRYSLLVITAVALCSVAATATAETLCFKENKMVNVSVHSASCMANPCIVKFQPGHKAYFEFQPASCSGSSQDFFIQVTKKANSAKPKLLKCSGNASCPKALDVDGKTPSFRVEGKTFVTIQY